MQLTLKLTLGILIGLALQLALNVNLRVRREADLLEGDVKKDHVILGRALSVDLIEEWRDRGPAAFAARAEKMNAERAQLDIRAVEVGKVPDDVVEGIRDGAPLQRLQKVTGDERLVTWLPLQTRGELFAAIKIEESLGWARAYVRNTVLRSAMWAVSGVAVSAGFAWLFGFILVGRPVRAMVDKARRVGEGDLSGPLPTTRGDELGVLATEINAMCVRLGEARDELERATQARIDAVKQLRHADRLSTLGLLSAGLAHELGTPLNIVAGRARLIADRPDVDPDVVRDATLIEQQAQRVEHLVRQLLDFARARRSEKNECDLGKLAGDTADMLRSLAQKRRVEIAVDIDDGAIARIDAGQIQQALMNLVVNAVHASSADQTVRLEVRKRDDEVHVAVVDEGIGMDDETIAQVFTPFFTTKDVGEGTGLGLAVAWGLVQENGGKITVESEKGKGSVFTIRFSNGVSSTGVTA